MEETHDNWDSEDGQAEEQVTIWGVRRKLLAAYFWLFSLLFAGVSGVAVWLEWAKAAPGNRRSHHLDGGDGRGIRAGNLVSSLFIHHSGGG